MARPSWAGGPPALPLPLLLPLPLALSTGRNAAATATSGEHHPCGGPDAAAPVASLDSPRLPAPRLDPASLRPDALAVATGELRPPRSLPPPSSCGRRALCLPHQTPRARSRTRSTRSNKEVTPASLPRLVAEEKGDSEKFWQPADVTLNRTGVFET